MTIFENDIQEITTTIMRKPVSNHLRILLYREIPSLMNRTSKRMPPRRFVTPRPTEYLGPEFDREFVHTHKMCITQSISICTLD